MAQRFIARIFFLALGFSCASPVSRGAGIPTIEWSHRFGSDTDDGALGISTDPAGDIYVSGYTYGDLAIPHISNNAPRMNNGQAFLRKYDSQGTLLWSNVVGGPQGEGGWSVSADKLGNVFMMGVTTENLYGPAAGGWDIYVTKFSEAGVFQWGKQFGSSGSESPGGLSADGLGNVYISGMTGGNLGGTNAGQNDAFLVKYDSGGNRVWTRQFGNNLDQSADDVYADDAGHVYVSGGTSGNLAGPSAGGTDMFVARYDNAGNREWIRQLGSTGLEDGANVATDAVGNVYVSGETNDPAGAVGGTDILLVKYDAAGSLQWTRQWGSTSSEVVQSDSLAIDKNGNAYVSGIEYGDFVTVLGGRTDIFLSKVDPAGNVLWNQQIGIDYVDTSPSISVDDFGNLYLSGETRIVSVLSAEGIADAFLIKINEVPEPGTMGLATLSLFLGCTIARRGADICNGIGNQDAGESGIMPSPHPASRSLHPVVWRVGCKIGVAVDAKSFEQPMLLPQLWKIASIKQPVL